ncbi:hypothetical protein E2562_020191 [Oryza meyeriana var. granulata]|uniref:Uncharacterized protein n=1 Tax=Oryza meyeriana var. granulata TaxID=110450 RepID=A0A6G1BMJ0_9ORYZ|nr:hypothetical protein E2562_020191 [Oryza meyeriana var. granulata]
MWSMADAGRGLVNPQGSGVVYLNGGGTCRRLVRRSIGRGRGPSWVYFGMAERRGFRRLGARRSITSVRGIAEGKRFPSTSSDGASSRQL